MTAMTGHWGRYLDTRMAVAPQVVSTTTAATLHLQDWSEQQDQ